MYFSQELILLKEMYTTLNILTTRSTTEQYAQTAVNIESELISFRWALLGLFIIL